MPFGVKTKSELRLTSRIQANWGEQCQGCKMNSARKKKIANIVLCMVRYKLAKIEMKRATELIAILDSTNKDGSFLKMNF